MAKENESNHVRNLREVQKQYQPDHATLELNKNISEIKSDLKDFFRNFNNYRNMENISKDEDRKTYLDILDATKRSIRIGGLSKSDVDNTRTREESRDTNKVLDNNLGSIRKSLSPINSTLKNLEEHIAVSNEINRKRINLVDESSEMIIEERDNSKRSSEAIVNKLSTINRSTEELIISMADSLKQKETTQVPSETTLQKPVERTLQESKKETPVDTRGKSAINRATEELVIESEESTKKKKTLMRSLYENLGELVESSISGLGRAMKVSGGVFELTSDVFRGLGKMSDFGNWTARTSKWLFEKKGVEEEEDEEGIDGKKKKKNDSSGVFGLVGGAFDRFRGMLFGKGDGEKGINPLKPNLTSSEKYLKSIDGRIKQTNEHLYVIESIDGRIKQTNEHLYVIGKRLGADVSKNTEEGKGVLSTIASYIPMIVSTIVPMVLKGGVIATALLGYGYVAKKWFDETKVLLSGDREEYAKIRTPSALETRFRLLEENRKKNIQKNTNEEDRRSEIDIKKVNVVHTIPTVEQSIPTRNISDTGDMSLNELKELNKNVQLMTSVLREEKTRQGSTTNVGVR